MTIEVLITIHEILKERAEVERLKMKQLYEARNAAEEEGKENYETLQALYAKARETMLKTAEALDAFEQHEW